MIEPVNAVLVLTWLFGLGVHVFGVRDVLRLAMPATVDAYRGTEAPEFTNYVDSFIPVFVASLALELIISLSKERRKRLEGAPGRSAANETSLYPYYRLNDTLNSMSLGSIQQMLHVGTFVKSLMIVPYVYVWEHYAIVRLPPTWATWFLCFLLVDLGYYVYHRLGHEVNAFWALHSTHHSSTHYNLSTALRQGALQYSAAWIFYVPGALLIPPPIFSVHSHINRLYQFWIHTELIPKFHDIAWLPTPVGRFIEFVFNTPSHHRVHHGSNPKYLDTNYGGTLILFDRLFGTFQDEEEQVVYGLTTNLDSWNPLWDTAAHWVNMLNLARTCRGVDKLRVLWKGPAWTPDGDYPVPDQKPGQKLYDSMPPAWETHPVVVLAYELAHYLTVVVALKLICRVAGGMFAFESIALCLHIVAVCSGIGLVNDRSKIAVVFESVRVLGSAGLLAAYLVARAGVDLWSPAVVAVASAAFASVVAVKFICTPTAAKRE